MKAMPGLFIRSFFRSILKQKVFFIINLLGFTLGLCVSLLIFLYVDNELKYDKYHEDGDRIYRLCIRASIGDTKFRQAFSSARVLREMRERYPEIEDAVKTFRMNDITTRVGDRVYHEDLLVLADSSVFSVFTFPVVAGNPETALVHPNSVAISEKYAGKYFGNTDCLGEIIEIDVPNMGETAYTVTCVYENMPVNSHFHFDIVASLTTFPGLINNNEWSANNFITYLLLKEGVFRKGLEDKFIQYVYDSTGGKDEYEARAAQGDYWEFFLQPLGYIHLHSDINGEWETNGNIKSVYIFSVVALFLLVIACINFVNLSVAKSTLRAREVGIRKAAGSGRRQLVIQFLAESAVITFFALVLSFVIVKILLPYYNDWLDRDISLSLFGNAGAIIALLAGWLIISMLTGIYPALFLSSYDPVRVLKANTISETRGVGIRNILVIIQFAASVFLITGTIVITKEMKMLQDVDLGFDKSDVLLVHIPPSFSGKQQIMRDELMKYPVIENVTFSSGLPGKRFSNIGFTAEGVDKRFTLNLYSADHAYDDVLKLETTAGRFFSEDMPTDTTAVLLNETAVKVLGIEDPLGKHINDYSSPPVNYRIIGILKDFHYESKHREIRPLAIFFQGGPWGYRLSYMAIRFSQGNYEEGLKAANLVWDKHMPGIPFRYSYLGDDYDSLYRNERQTKQVFIMHSFLAILVACMGLFGLASFIAQQQKPEVAIRKVMGASAGQLVLLLNRKYTGWIAIAFAIACPLSYYFMSRWLDNFAYRISIGPLVFILAGAITLIVALVTVSGITSRTANTDPAIVLRSE